MNTTLFTSNITEESPVWVDVSPVGGIVLRNVDFSNSTTCGVDFNDRVYCSTVGNTDWAVYGSSTYYSVSLTGDRVCGINSGATSSQYLNCFLKSVGTVTTPSTSNFGQISVGTSRTCGVDTSFTIKCAVYGTWTWTTIVGTMEYVSVDDGVLLGIDLNNVLYFSLV